VRQRARRPRARLPGPETLQGLEEEPEKQPGQRRRAGKHNECAAPAAEEENETGDVARGILAVSTRSREPLLLCGAPTRHTGSVDSRREFSKCKISPARAS